MDKITKHEAIYRKFTQQRSVRDLSPCLSESAPDPRLLSELDDCVAKLHALVVVGGAGLGEADEEAIDLFMATLLDYTENARNFREQLLTPYPKRGK